jgi:hypothetical protein
MIVCFDDIGGIDDQHCLSFLLIILLKTSEIMFTHCIFPKIRGYFPPRIAPLQT